MSWSGLALNQMVSFTDAQGGGFTLQSGQSSVTSNQCMTKDDALTKYVLDSSYMSSYASNELVPKSTWVAGNTREQILNQYNDPCGSLITDLWYDSVSDLYYTSEAGSTLYSGSGYVYVGPDPSFGYVWSEYSYTSGVQTFIGDINSPCSPS
jgi:hypothetical protein